MKIITLILLLFAVILISFRVYFSPQAIKNKGQLIDFKNISLPNTPNYYLSCVDTLCPKHIPYTPSPIYPMNIKQLQQAWDKMLQSQPRVSLLDSRNEGKNRVYVQLSTWWNFPDFINVRFISLDSKHATLAVFSHSSFGYSDFGVNEKRVTAWLNALARRAH